MFSRNDSLVASITKYELLLIYLPQRDGRLSWPEHHECNCVNNLNRSRLLLESGPVMVELEPATSESLVRDLTSGKVSD